MIDDSLKMALAEGAVQLIVKLAAHPEVRAAVRALGADFHAATPAKTTNLSDAEIAAALGCSKPTVRRTLKPARFVGNAPRYDLADVYEQLAARGKRPSTPAKRAAADDADDVDVSHVMSRAGLRAVAGGRHA